MASVLKVDTLQKPDGSMPTAADLGIDVAGSVVATHKFISPTSTDLVISSESFTEVDTFTLDVKRDNSIMIIWVDTQQYIKSVQNTNLSMRLLVDGVAVGQETSRTEANQPGLFHVWYGNTAREVLYNHYITQPLSKGTHTFKLDAFRYNTGTITLKYQNGAFRYLAQEIAQ